MSVHAIGKGKARRYRVRWREAGRNRQRTFDSYDHATGFDSHIRAQRQLRGVDHVIGSDTTLKEYADQWWEEVALPNLGVRTIEQYGLALDLRIVPGLGGERLRDIKPATIERWIADLERDGHKRPSVLRAVRVLGTIMQRAAANGVIDSNPVRLARKPRAPAARRPDPITPVQVEAIRVRLDLFDATLVSVLAYAGLRPESEALLLRWSDIGERTINVRATKTGTTRHVRLLAPLAEDLDAWREASSGGGLVFPRDGGEWTRYDWQNWRRRVWRPAATAVGLPADSRPRDLRGSFASLLIYEGRNIVEVAGQLGHSPSMCLDTYAGQFEEAPDPEQRVTAETAIRDARAHALGSYPPEESSAGEAEESTAVVLSFRRRASRRARQG